MNKIISKITIFFIIFQILTSCGIYRPVDAKKYPPQPELRVKNNLKEGRGIKLFKSDDKGGKFEFANANPLWRASLDTIDFMPLLSVDYGGGIIITDWYGEENENDSIKITIQFLSNEIKKGKITSYFFTKEKKEILLHGHCHQKALSNVEDSVWLLSLPENYSVEVIPSGCCGMAGSFGYEKEHFEVSQQVGNLVLFPKVRNAKSAIEIVAPGTSCRHQIFDGTGKKANA